MTEILIDTALFEFLERQFNPAPTLGNLALHLVKCDGNKNGNGSGDGLPGEPFPPEPLPPPNGRPKEPEPESD
jgi:hypothetical protein